MYEQIALYYDLTHAGLTEDLDAIRELAQQVDGPLLELGCGTGRVLLPLARDGHTITGLDNSPAMLARARAYLADLPPAAQARVTLVEADMRDFTLPGEDGRYALIFIAYNTFMQLTPTQMSAALHRIRPYLAQDGRLFIDLANPFEVAQTPNDRIVTLENSLIHPETGDAVLQFACDHLDEAAQVLTTTWIYDTSPAQGGPVHRIAIQAPYHYLFPHQMELMLQDADYRLLSLHGDYAHRPFAEDSSRMLVLAARG